MTGETLNEHQQRRLRVTCQYIDKLLADAEAALAAAESHSPFPKYVVDLAPVERRTLEDYFARIRARLVQALQGQNIEPIPPTIPVSRAVHTSLVFASVSVEELRPRYMRGYGEVPPSVATELNGIAGELEQLVAQVDRFLAAAGQPDLGARLSQMEEAGNDVTLLRKLEQVISDLGLVEFRSPLANIVNRLQDNSFEIAVFGRVSSGKSSLLNAVIGEDVLPIGVTPITAVPTRIAHGSNAQLTVAFASRPPETVEVACLCEFATEQHNQGNAKRVTKIVVHLPSPTLREGIVFVDTPGLGSLATSGATETLAYLPQCDMGVVLIDASSTLTPDDLGTLRTLYHAGIPATVLLSKADLLSDTDREQLVSYIRRELKAKLGLEIPVRGVSTRPEFRDALHQWFEEDIAPLYGRHQSLKEASLRRKTGALRESIVAALRSQLHRSEHVSAAAIEPLRKAETALRQTTAELHELSNSTDAIDNEVRTAGMEAVRESAGVFSTLAADRWEVQATGDIVATILAKRVQEVAVHFQEKLRTAAEQALQALADVARTIETPESPAREDFLDPIRSMPVFEAPPLIVQPRRPRFASLLGSDQAANAIAAATLRQAGKLLDERLGTYAALLRAWAEQVIAQLQAVFTGYADRYRTQIERLSGGEAANLEAVRNALTQLGDSATLPAPLASRIA